MMNSQNSSLAMLDATNMILPHIIKRRKKKRTVTRGYNAIPYYLYLYTLLLNLMLPIKVKNRAVLCDRKQTHYLRKTSDDQANTLSLLFHKRRKIKFKLLHMLPQPPLQPQIHLPSTIQIHLLQPHTRLFPRFHKPFHLFSRLSNYIHRL